MKKSKWFQGLLLGTTGFALLGFGACNLGAGDTFTGFLDGVATQVRRGETVYLEEFIDYAEKGTYTITILGGDMDEAEDLTDKKRWAADYPGEYTLTYVISEGKNKGTYTHTFVVPADTISWAHATEPITIMYEKTFDFSWFFEELNLSVFSYYDYEAFIENIRIGDEVIAIENSEDSYYVEDLGTHYITYGVRTLDGQEVKSIATANVIYSENQSDLYLTENSDGNYEIAVENAQSVKINGETCALAEISASGVSISKQVLYQNYAGTNFISIITQDGEEVRDTVNVYTSFVSFEGGNAVAPSFLTLHEGYKWHLEVGRLSISDKFVTDGEKSLEVITTAYYWPQFLLHMDYLDMIFADENVDEFAFDVTYAGTKEEHTHRTFTLNGYGTGGTLYRNVASTIRMTRAKYEQLKADIAASIEANAADSSKSVLPNGWQMTLQNTRDAAGGWDNPAKMYFDNFRAIYALGAETMLTSDTSLGDLTLDVAGVEKVTVNGQQLADTVVRITENNVVIDIEWLRANAGANVVALKVGNKYYEKIINVFDESYDFEEMDSADKAKFVTWNIGLTKNATTSLVDFNGSKALRMYTQGGYWAQFQINGDWLESLFKNPSVDYIAFDMTLDNCGNAEVTSRSVNSNAMSRLTFFAGEVMHLAITREKFEAMRASTPNDNVLITMDNQTTQPGGEVPTAWILDNFRAMEHDAESDPSAETYFKSGSSTCIFATAYGNGQLLAGAYPAYEGIYSLRALLGTGKQWTGMTFRKGMSAGQLQKVFSDEAVTGYSFYMYNPNSFDAYVNFCATSAYPTYSPDKFAEQAAAATKLEAGKWTKVTLSRETYETLVNTSSNNILVMQLFAENTPTANSYFYIDSFQVEKA